MTGRTWQSTDIVAAREGQALRHAIAGIREHESFLRRAIRVFGRWAICSGCRQSATGSYNGHQCCTRCQLVIT